ncbi:hypothetical protein DVA76_18030, partial [Acinetobacter baumannii]
THIKSETRGHTRTLLGVDKHQKACTPLVYAEVIVISFRYCQRQFFSTSKVSDHTKPEPFKSMLSGYT